MPVKALFYHVPLEPQPSSLGALLPMGSKPDRKNPVFLGQHFVEQYPDFNDGFVFGDQFFRVQRTWSQFDGHAQQYLVVLLSLDGPAPRVAH